MLDFSAIGLALNWWLIGSYHTGEFIVYTGVSFFRMLVNAVRNFNSVIILLYEGSTLWLQDIHELLCVLQEFIRNSSNYLIDIAYSLVAIFAEVIYAPFSILAAILASIRELLFLLGSSCLFLLSLPPLFLFYFIDALLHVFKTFGSFARFAAKRLAEHAADLQTLEVLIGLVVGCGLIILAVNGIKLLVKFHQKFKTRAIKVLQTTWRRVKTVTSRRRGENNDCKLQETELCIVCFTKARSVCLLPCRHLCLCVTCTESLPYPLRCPLCRQRAEDLIHVYL